MKLRGALPERDAYGAVTDPSVIVSRHEAAAGRLKAAAAAFASNAVNGNLRRAQLSFLGAWTAEWAFTVALGIVAYRDGGATAVGLVGLLRMVPSAVVAPLAAPLADRGRRERVLVLVSTIRGIATGAAGIVVALDGPVQIVYVLAVLSTIAGDSLPTRTFRIAPISVPDRAGTRQRERRTRDVGFDRHAGRSACWPLCFWGSPTSPLCSLWRQLPRWPRRPCCCDCVTTLRPTSSATGCPLDV